MVACLLAVVLAAGCAGRPALPPAGPEPLASPSAVPGMGLERWRISNGPAQLSLPEGTHLVRAVDQPNVVSLFFDAPSQEVTLQHLRRALPTAGLGITHDSGGALLCEGDVWEGAYTHSGGLNVLTLRRR